jgi:hypothetical protein
MSILSILLYLGRAKMSRVLFQRTRENRKTDNENRSHWDMWFKRYGPLFYFGQKNAMHGLDRGTDIGGLQ